MKVNGSSPGAPASKMHTKLYTALAALARVVVRFAKMMHCAVSRLPNPEKCMTKLINTMAVRIDKWLWAARFFKTRTLAADAVDNGKVRVAGERVKTARLLKPGEVLQIDHGATEWEVTVLALSDVRGSATQAQLLYAETETSLAERAKATDERKYFREPGTTIKGRPTKRDRRRIDKSTE